MLFASNEQIDPENHHWEIISSIHNAMAQISSSVQFEPWIPTDTDYQVVTYITIMQINSTHQKIKLYWEFKLLSHVLILKISLLDQQHLSQQIKILCRKFRQKIIFYFNHINNINFSQNQGQFYAHGDGKIIFQYRQDNWFALKNPIKLRHHLSRKLKKISEMFNRNIQSFLVKFKLIPDKEFSKETQQIIYQLNKMKYFFQESKKNPCYPPQLYQTMLNYHKNCSDIDFRKVQKFDKKILMLIQSKIIKHQTTFNKEKTTQYEQLKYKFKSKSSAYMNFSQHNSITYPLVIAMQIIEVKNQTPLKQKGGFGQITKGIYSCKYGKTIYDDINKQLQGQVHFSEQIFNRYLCKKSSLEKNCQAFQNQKLALMKLRNKRNPYIAQYYCNITKGKPFDDGNIFMEVYSSNIENIPIKLKHKFKILMQIIKGLSFLNSNGIIHRDLKPQNVVVDRQMNSKLIDFGSCSNIYQRYDLFKPYDSKCTYNIITVRSTKGYFVPYQQYTQALENKQKKLGKQQFYEHYFFDIYSYGKIIQKIFNLSEYEFVEQDLLMSQMYYLYEKCCEINPADRLAHQQIQFFLQNLLRLDKSILI